MPYSAYTKDPNAVEVLSFDWVPYLGAGETITASTWPTSPSGITVVTTGFTVNSVTIKLSGGTNRQDYRFVNHVVTNGGEYDWELVVRVSETLSLPTGPPFATISEAESHHPAAEGAEALSVEMMLQTASEWVADLAPRPKPVTALLSAGMSASQDYVPLPKIELWEHSGTVKIENEILRYSFKESDVTTIYSNPLDIYPYPYAGVGKLTGAQRGRHATIPSTHAQGATVEDADYPLKARNAELAVFAWLWDTRGYKPSRTGVIGSESYSIDPSAIRNIVKVTMGKRYYGSAQYADVTSSFSRGRNRQKRPNVG